MQKVIIYKLYNRIISVEILDLRLNSGWWLKEEKMI